MQPTLALNAPATAIDKSLLPGCDCRCTVCNALCASSGTGLGRRTLHQYCLWPQHLSDTLRGGECNGAPWLTCRRLFKKPTRVSTQVWRSMTRFVDGNVTGLGTTLICGTANRWGCSSEVAQLSSILSALYGTLHSHPYRAGAVADRRSPQRLILGLFLLTEAAAFSLRRRACI